MKKLPGLTALLFLWVPVSSYAQTIRIADNNANRPAGINIFPTIQAAVDAAAVGDIVYVQPSTISYGDVTINKKITLRGIGFNTGKDLSLTSNVNNIGLTNTLDNTTNASGTTIEGIDGNQIFLGYQTGTFTYTLENVTISNCSLSLAGIARGSGYMPAKNIVVQNCFTGISFTTTGTVSEFFVYRNFLYQVFLDGAGNLSSMIMSNNIIDKGNSNRFGAICCDGAFLINSVIITNNNFLSENDIPGSRFMAYDLHDAIVTNNIFYGCAPVSTNGNFERNTFSNNLSFGTSNDALPPAGTGVGNTGANNKVSADPLFVNAPFNVAYAPTMNFNLQASSPAKNAGTDGTDIGITGGSYPITGNTILGLPSSAPVIMTLNPAAMVPQGQPLKTNIKAKSY
ncbi:MAG: hypothetical protein WDN75_07825 [Bacteroidota bacterium]